MGFEDFSGTIAVSCVLGSMLFIGGFSRRGVWHFLFNFEGRKYRITGYICEQLLLEQCESFFGEEMLKEKLNSNREGAREGIQFTTKHPLMSEIGGETESEIAEVFCVHKSH